MYAMPREKKYPLNTKNDVRDAVTLFGAHHRKYPVSKRRSAARAIRKRARDLGYKIGDDTWVMKYARMR